MATVERRVQVDPTDKRIHLQPQYEGDVGYGYGYGHSGYYEEEAPKKSFLDKVTRWFAFKR